MTSVNRFNFYSQDQVDGLLTDQSDQIDSAIDAHLGGDSTGLVSTVAAISMNVSDHGAVGDGTTDDTAAINAAAATLAAAGGGTLRFTPGKTYAVSALNLVSNVEYYGFGATIKCLSNASLGPFVGNGSNGTNVQVRGFRIDANGLAQRAAYFANCTGYVFEHNYVFNFGTSNAKEGIRLAPSSSSCVVRNNTVVGPVDSPHGTVTSGFEGVMVLSTTPDTYGGGNNATLTFPTTPVTNPSTSHSITGNWLYNGLHGITMSGAQNCDVSGNWCINGSERGIIMSPVCTGNIIRGNHCTGVVSTGIHMAWGCRFNLIENNYIDATGTSAIEGSGIKGYYGCSDNTIRNNIVRGTASYAYGSLYGSSRNDFDGNRADSCHAGVYIMSAYTSASGSPLPYSVPAQLPDSDSNVVRNNILNGCVEGVRIDADATASSGYGNTTNTTVSGNKTIGSTTPYAIREWGGGVVSGINATDNTSANTVGAGVTWTLARGERHFVHKASNSGIANTPPGWMVTGQGMWYASPVAGTFSTTATTNGVLRVAPLYVPNTVTLSSVGVEVTAAGTAGSLVRIGIYADNGYGQPSDLVLDCGTIDGTVVGVSTVAIIQPLTPGTYWIGAVCQGSPTTTPTVRAVLQSAWQVSTTAPIGTSTPAAGAIPAFGWAAVSITGALPAKFGTALVSSVLFRMVAKVQ